MLSKNEAKYIQSLSHKKTRGEEGVFVVEGPKIVAELLASDYTIRKIYAVDEWANPAGKDVEVLRISQQELQRISGLQAANMVLATAEQKQLTGIPVLKNNLVLALDNIQDPGNMGTIIRIADWFGISQVVASPDTVELYNPKVMQGTMGSFVRVNVWYNDLESILQQTGGPVYGALLQGQPVYEMGRITEGLLLVGNESKGINDHLKQYITQPVTIPRIGQADSLNAAVAMGIILSHIV